MHSSQRAIAANLWQIIVGCHVSQQPSSWPPKLVRHIHGHVAQAVMDGNPTAAP
jgi:hypothetical protein